MPLTSLESQILLNQISQEVRPLDDAEAYLNDDESVCHIWDSLETMVFQAHPSREDIEEAIQESGLKSTFTPCVMLLKDQKQFQIKKS